MREEKVSWRRTLGERLKTVSASEQKTAGPELCARLRPQPIWQAARAVLLFAPMPCEPDILSLLEEALRSKPVVALPRFVPARKDYEVCQIANLADLQRGSFGIREPASHCAVTALNQLDFALVPGVAFDRCGRRLGRGKGYYDRLLAQFRGHKCGVAFDWQVIPAVPCEPHDVVLDSLLTPSFWCKVASPNTV